MNERLLGVVEASEKSVPLEITLLLLTIGLLILIWDIFERRSRRLQHGSGLSSEAELLSAKGSSRATTHELYAPELGLRSRPDALIREGEHIIPVDIKPMSSKIRDRHVVGLLMHMRLIEALEGVRPPYGILLMGSSKRQVRIKNTPEKQRWLDSLLDEMRSIRDQGIPAVPSPAPFKCRNCDVREVCAHSLANGSAE
ncbi:MAG: Dna2/Cas4 domain-containing protein [Bdellovibrionales bacterium]|nr:Dna2/Cas4 domain-containing protein [Bdellovibrionales bacterium]